MNVLMGNWAILFSGKGRIYIYNNTNGHYQGWTPLQLSQDPGPTRHLNCDGGRVDGWGGRSGPRCCCCCCCCCCGCNRCPLGPDCWPLFPAICVPDGYKREILLFDMIKLHLTKTLLHFGFVGPDHSVQIGPADKAVSDPKLTSIE